MHNRIRLSAFLMLLTSILCFSGCKKDSAENKIEGEWKSAIAFNEFMSVLEGETAFDSVKEEIEITATFKEGTYTLKIDTEKAINSTEFNLAMADYIRDMLGMTDKEIKEAYGKDIKALAKEKTEEMRETFSIGETMSYEFKDGKLLLGEAEQPFRFDGEDILILDLENFGELEFKKN